jgi:hypothetical protein
MRAKAPRADRLDKIRDIAIILHENNGQMSKKDLLQQIKSRITPPQLNSWTVSNIREYIAALVFLKLAFSPIRTMIYLTNLGAHLATKGNFGVANLNENEREILREAIFQNARFRIFLALFTGFKVPRNAREFVTIGKSLKLKHSELRTELDRREVEDIFKSWALNIEIIEWNSTTDEYFPVMRREIDLDKIFTSLLEAYNQIEDKTIKRAEIYKIKDIICQEYRIPRRQFYDYLLKINKRYSDRVRLEVIPITMVPIRKFKLKAAEHFGIETSKGIYYYIKILNSWGCEK